LRLCVVFATETQWFARLSAGLMQRQAGGLKAKTKRFVKKKLVATPKITSLELADNSLDLQAIS
jgi:hypothetical protein